MANVQPLRALYPDQAVAGPMQVLASPPYDVIDDAQREELAARSPHNAVHVDLPRAPDGGDPYAHAGTLLRAWEAEGALVRDARPALWPLRQDYTGPDGRARRRDGFLARVRVEPYGPGRIRAHERTHPGPKEDRLKLTRATRANLSPIFSLFGDPDEAVGDALEAATDAEPFTSADDHEGTRNTLWRVADPTAISTLQAALADAELLIADGHHRYETARLYAEEVGGEGEHRYVLMLLCALSDPGLTVFPTHRLLTGLKDDTASQQALREAVMRDFEVAQVSHEELEPSADEGRVQLGYMDSFHKQPHLLTLKDPAIAEAALPDRPGPYQRLDTAVLEAIVLKGALGMSEDDISHLRGLSYSKSFDDALEAVESGRADAGFFMRATPVDQVREVAETGESMPPKSTYFYPKIPTGLIFSLLE